MEEQVDVVLGGEKGADVAVEHQVRLDGTLDRLRYGWVRRPDEVAELGADLPLPGGQAFEVGIYTRWAQLAMEPNLARRGLAAAA